MKGCLDKQNEDVSINITTKSASDESTYDDKNLNDSEGNPDNEHIKEDGQNTNSY